MNINHSEEIKKNVLNLQNVRDEYKGLSIEEIREKVEEDRLPYAVCCISLHGDLNVGAIIRTAHILGAKEVIVFGRRKYDARSTVGAENYFKVTKIHGFEDNGLLDAELLKDYFVENKYYPIFVENTNNSIDIREINWEVDRNYYILSKPCFVFGNEGTGIPDEILEIGKHFPMSCIVSIPQRGSMRCLNVASAASIVLWDYVKAKACPLIEIVRDDADF